MKFFFLILLFTASIAYGEIYRWSDREGVVHFSNSVDDIPGRYRSRAKSMNYGSDQKGELPGGQAQPSAAVAPPVEPQVRQMNTPAAEPSKNEAIRRRVGRGGRHLPLQRGDEE